MQLRTLINKTVDTVKLLMVQPTMIFRLETKSEAFIQDILTIEEGEQGRPDLLALRAYGDVSKLDMILKFNGISDPFSMQVGDEIKIPREGTPYYKMERPNLIDENPIKRQYMDTKRLPSKDKARIEAMKKKYNKEALLPPNVIPAGQKTYKFVGGGQVVFGAQAQSGQVNTSNTPDYTGSTTNNQTPNDTTNTALTDAANVELVNNNVNNNFDKTIDVTSKLTGNLNGGSADGVGGNSTPSGNPSGNTTSNTPSPSSGGC
jgi:hypothetical protein